jgi:hypothetical protein
MGEIPYVEHDTAWSITPGLMFAQLVGTDHPRMYRPPRPVTCKKCGATNLKWRAEGGRWVLVENERVQPGNYKPEHLCPTKDNNLEGFD